MEQQITIARPAALVLAYLADPANLPSWLPLLRRMEGPLPEGGLVVEQAVGRIAWAFPPAGEWRVRGEGPLSVVTLALRQEHAPPSDPTEAETPREAAWHGLEAALHSLKSHLERARGGDPDLPMPAAPARAYGHALGRDEGL
ncbi:SRPBCC family protein [Roseomonas sp. GC11]|uniref:SRPBCC family protein n=1 Tax=Roseomonas sp. GC11 TaxID=2950546 RepID=UPI00272ECBC2|nr:SRPBCC family protein [Roseomonas sp. GC11]